MCAGSEISTTLKTLQNLGSGLHAPQKCISWWFLQTWPPLTPTFSSMSGWKTHFSRLMVRVDQVYFYFRLFFQLLVSFATLQNEAGEKTGWNSTNQTRFKTQQLHVWCGSKQWKMYFAWQMCDNSTRGEHCLFKAALTLSPFTPDEMLPAVSGGHSPSLLRQCFQLCCTCRLLSLWPSLWLESRGLKRLEPSLVFVDSQISLLTCYLLELWPIKVIPWSLLVIQAPHSLPCSPSHFPSPVPATRVRRSESDSAAAADSDGEKKKPSSERMSAIACRATRCSHVRASCIAGGRLQAAGCKR